jgi:hypothetical protein
MRVIYIISTTGGSQQQPLYAATAAMKGNSTCGIPWRYVLTHYTVSYMCYTIPYHCILTPPYRIVHATHSLTVSLHTDHHTGMPLADRYENPGPPAVLGSTGPHQVGPMVTKQNTYLSDVPRDLCCYLRGCLQAQLLCGGGCGTEVAETL